MLCGRAICACCTYGGVLWGSLWSLCAVWAWERLCAVWACFLCLLYLQRDSLAVAGSVRYRWMPACSSSGVGHGRTDKGCVMGSLSSKGLTKAV